MWFDGVRQPNTIYVANSSHGKDSTAMLRAIQLMGWPLDYVISTDIWFDDETPAELPPMAAYKDEWDRKCLENFGVPVTRLCAMTTPDKKNYPPWMAEREREREREQSGSPDCRCRLCYTDYFYKRLSKGKYTGNIKGFPTTTAGWCRHLKYEIGEDDLLRHLLSESRSKGVGEPQARERERAHPRNSAETCKATPGTHGNPRLPECQKQMVHRGTQRRCEERPQRSVYQEQTINNSMDSRAAMRSGATANSKQEHSTARSCPPPPRDRRTITTASQRGRELGATSTSRPMLRETNNCTIRVSEQMGEPLQQHAQEGCHVKKERHRRNSPFSDKPSGTKGEKINIVHYVGIAADEPERIARHMPKKDMVLPLVQIGWEEPLCGLIAQYLDMLAPTYDTGERDGCWFCHNQGVKSLRNLRKTYPELWARLMILDNDSPVTFHPDGRTIHDFDRRFQLEDEGHIDPNGKFRWYMIDEDYEQMGLFNDM